MNPTKNKGNKMVERINVLLVTLVKYSLLMMSQTLFMVEEALLVSCFEFSGSVSVIYLTYEYVIQ